MKRSNILSAFASLAFLTATASAYAADLAVKSRPYAPAYGNRLDWSGFYVGLNAGYGWGTSTWTNPAVGDGFAIKGGLAGATLGYNYQTGNWVWGLEGDLAASWIKGSNNAGGAACGGAGCQTSNSWLGTGRARIGYAWGRWLPFLSGGAAFGNIKMTPNAGGSASSTQLGWTVGSGVEYALSRGWSTKLEYLYVNLGKATCSAAVCGVDTSVNFKTSVARVGLNYRF